MNEEYGLLVADAIDGDDAMRGFLFCLLSATIFSVYSRLCVQYSVQNMECIILVQR